MTKARWYSASYSPAAVKLFAEHGREIARQILSGAVKFSVGGKVVRKGGSFTVIR